MAEPGETLLLCQFNRFGFRFIKIGTVQQHFATETANGIDFDIRGSRWHDDQRLHPKARRGEGHALSMVSCRRGDHALRFCASVRPAIIA